MKSSLSFLLLLTLIACDRDGPRRPGVPQVKPEASLQPQTVFPIATVDAPAPAPSAETTLVATESVVPEVLPAASDFEGTVLNTAETPTTVPPVVESILNTDVTETVPAEIRVPPVLKTQIFTAFRYSNTESSVHPIKSTYWDEFSRANPNVDDSRAYCFVGNIEEVCAAALADVQALNASSDSIRFKRKIDVTKCRAGLETVKINSRLSSYADTLDVVREITPCGNKTTQNHSSTVLHGKIVEGKVSLTQGAVKSSPDSSSEFCYVGPSENVCKELAGDFEKSNTIAAILGEDVKRLDVCTTAAEETIGIRFSVNKINGGFSQWGHTLKPCGL